MKLKALTLENFKGISDPVRIEFSPITLLFGPNNAGKSTVLHALIYAREIFGRGNVDPRYTEMGGETVDLGGFDSLVFAHDRARKIRMRLEFDIDVAELTKAVKKPYSPYDTEEDYDAIYTGSPSHWSHRSLCFARGHLPSVEEALEALAITWLELSVGWCPLSQRAIIERCEVGGGKRNQPLVRLSYNQKIGSAQLALLDFGIIPFGKIETEESIGLRENPVEQPIPWYQTEEEQQQQRAYDEWNRNHCEALKAASIGTTALLLGLIKPEFLSESGQLLPMSFDQESGAMPGETGWLPLSNHCYWHPFYDEDHKENDYNEKTRSWSSEEHQSGIPDWVDPRQVAEQFLDPLLNAASVGVVNCCRSFFARSLYLSTVRIHPPRDFHAVLPLDPRRWPNGLAAWDLLVERDDELLEPLNQWLNGDESRFGSGFRIEIHSIKQVDTREPSIETLIADGEDANLEAIRAYLAELPEERRLRIRHLATGVLGHPRDVGYGLSQLIPVIVAALDTKTGIVSVEEPESNIHPAFQVVLADLFITQAKANPNALFLIETHSEHLMLRCLRRIRETGDGELESGLPSVTPDDVAVHFVEPSEQGPAIHRIRIDKDGEFMDPWPRGFFPERMKEVYGDDL